MNTNTIRGLASIIVPCFNQREYTRSCLQSLFHFTRAPWELIVVDNGSTDDTKTYLAGVQDATAVPVTVVANPRNLGFPAAINQGLQLAQGEYLVLLNNDVVVTESWLDQLTALATAKVGPTAESAEIITENAEIAATRTEGENRNLTVIDFNEVRGEIARGSTAGPLPSPPWPPLHKRGTIYVRRRIVRCEPRPQAAQRWGHSLHPPWAARPLLMATLHSPSTPLAPVRFPWRAYNPRSPPRPPLRKGGRVHPSMLLCSPQRRRVDRIGSVQRSAW